MVPDVTDRRRWASTAPNRPWHRVQAAARPTAVWSAWSCLVRVVVTDPQALDAVVELAIARMDAVERVASRFVVDSDLNWANVNSGRPIAVPRLLIDLVSAALDGARRSGGALDPTVGRHVVDAGYDRDILLVTDSTRRARDPHLTGRTWADVVLDAQMGLLTVPAGCSLDLGATAKAQTADWIARTAHDRFGTDVLVEIGGDVAVHGKATDWQLDVAERAGASGQQIGLRRGGLATSTTTVRTWRRDGQRMHHIIDPHTCRPADGPWRTVTVAATSALAANVCSTAAIVLGRDAAGWLGDQGVAARLVSVDGTVSTLGGWPVEAAASGGRC